MNELDYIAFWYLMIVFSMPALVLLVDLFDKHNESKKPSK